MNSYVIQHFNLEKITSGVISIIGTRCVGKSTIIKDILVQKRHYKVGYIMCHKDHDYSDVVMESKISNYYNNYLLLQILDEQKKDNSKTNIVVLDDILSSKGDWINDEVLRELIIKSKELNILVILSFQYPHTLPDEFLNKIDFIFIFEQTFPHNRKRIYNIYTKNIFENYDQYEKIVYKICNMQTFTTMVLDRNSESTNIMDRIYRFNSYCFQNNTKNYSYIPLDIKDIFIKDTDSDTETDDTVSTPKQIIDKQSESSSLSYTTSNVSSNTDHYMKLLVNDCKRKKTRIQINLESNTIIINKNDTEIEFVL